MSLSQKFGPWGRARAALLLLAALVGVGVGSARAGGGPSWEALLAPHGVEKIVALRWLAPQEPGAWTLALAEAVPGAIEGQGAQGRRDLVLFEGLSDGEGRPWRVRRVGNLLRTPDADDVLLDLHAGQDGRRRALAGAKVDGVFTSLTILDLDGDPSAFLDAQGAQRPAGQRLMIAATQWQEEGRPGGVGARLYALEEPAAELLARFEDGQVVVRASPSAPGGAQRWATIQLADFKLKDVHGEPLVLLDQTQRPEVDSWIQFAVNRARGFSWIGTTKIARLEQYVFDQKSRLKQAWYGVVGVDKEALAQEIGPAEQGGGGGAEVSPVEEAKAPPSSAQAVLLGERGLWPPPDLDPPAKQWASGPVEGEGRWRRWVPAWADGASVGEGPWPVLTTSVRVDPKAEYEFVSLVAMDMRQLDLHLVAGTSNPRSTTGLKGDGLIPRDPETLRRLMLAFNGGFKTSHGAYGMSVERKVFVPPKPAMGTVGFWDDGSIRLGIWPGEAPTGNYREEQVWQSSVSKDGPPIPAYVASMRQNLPPIIGDGRLNPLGARRWGGPVAHLDHTSTPRSSIAACGNGTLMYVWCSSCGAGDLGKAMLLAGCQSGMHLDMNPFHTGLTMIHVPLQGDALPAEDGERKLRGAQVEVPFKKMQFDEYRFVKQEISDFFYVTRRAFLAERLGGGASGVPWAAKGLPAARDGLEPLAVSARTPQGAVLFGAEPGAFVAQAAPGEGAVGEVEVSLHLSQPAPATAAGRVGSREGRLVVAAKAEGLEGSWAGEPVAPGDERGERPVVAALTEAGDVVLGACAEQSCKLSDLFKLLEASRPQVVLWLGSGGLEVLGREAGGPVSVQAPSARTPSPARLRLVPKPVRERVGVSDFK